jgi:hypothetical protein
MGGAGWTGAGKTGTLWFHREHAGRGNHAHAAGVEEGVRGGGGTGGCMGAAGFAGAGRTGVAAWRPLGRAAAAAVSFKEPIEIPNAF